MSPSLWITDVRMVLPGEATKAGSVLVSDGRLARIDDPGTSCPPGATPVDGRGRLLTPGLIDLHTHGLGHFMYEKGPDDLLQIGRRLGAYGTTCVLPTIIPAAGPGLLEKLDRLAWAMGRCGECGCAAMPGLHLEGPFVALTGAACAPMAGDVPYLRELLAAAHGRVAAMSISPDTPGILPVIEHLRQQGIAVFMTHTRATAEQTEAAIAAGACHATHFYDVFPLPEETEPGVRPAGAVEAILADQRLTVDFICDGCHVAPVAIRSALAAKGCEGVAVITDANIGAGLPAGTYDTPWGYPVRVRPDDAARIADPNHRYYNCLAGSSLTMDRGIRNLMQWLTPRGLSPEQVWAMGTSTPARIAGLSNKGALCVGADADLVLWNEDLTVAATWVGGRCVYQA